VLKSGNILLRCPEKNYTLGVIPEDIEGKNQLFPQEDEDSNRRREVFVCTSWDFKAQVLGIGQDGSINASEYRLQSATLANSRSGLFHKFLGDLV
jgi:hypothetical protein